MTWWERLKNDQKGSISVLLAAGMVVMAGFAALVIDAGLLYLNKVRLVDAVDSAVLAGVQELPGSPSRALQVAAEYAALNGLEAGEVSFEVGEDNKSLTGSARRDVNLLFARLLGFEEEQVSSQAEARVVPLAGVSGVTPFGVWAADYEFGEEVILKAGALGEHERGWFGALRLGGSGADDYRNNVRFGYDGLLKIGDTVEVESGNMSGPTKTGIDYRIDRCHHSPECTINSYVDGCPRILIVPMGVMDGYTFTITGFGAFFVDEYVGHGNDNWVRGSFVRYAVPGEIAADAPDFGVYGTQLSN
ncbi:MAG: TadE/TadG family type IV pilus assembly protein [Syntrophomonadaceae bacterium]|jgi:hypothetical protein